MTNAYDGFGRQTSSTINLDGVTRTLSYQYDANSNRTRVTHPDGNWFGYSNDAANRPLSAGQGATSGLFAFTYNNQGQLTQKISGGTTSYAYEPAGRLSSIAEAFTGGTGNVTATFAYNPASQIVSRSRSNNAYAFTGYANVNRNYAVNGLNQYTSAGGVSFTYDANGNLTSDGSNSYLYDIENRLVSRSGAGTAGLRYDPLGRLYEVTGPSGTTRFLYDGDALVAEYNTSGTMLRRYVHGADAQADDPLVWYEGAGFTTPKMLKSDHQGSVIALSNGGGTLQSVNSYDEYGIPASTNTGRFQYTGQAWIPELGMYHYKARIYSPTLGRFLQTDPIGYDDQINLYAYVGNDPMNKVDPTGKRFVTIGRFAFRLVIRGDRVVEIVSVTAKEAAADWRTLDNHSTASFWQKLGSVADLILGTNFVSFNEIYDTDDSGKIKNPNLETLPVGDEELPNAIEQLDKSIDQRKKENDRFPRGNPNGSPEDKRNHSRRAGHLERISREEAKRNELASRLKNILNGKK